jgi:hypothetical protein
VAVAIAASGPAVPAAVDGMVNSAWEALDCQPRVDSSEAGAAPTCTYHVLAYARQVGSAGHFRPRRFEVDAPAGIHLAELARILGEQHGKAFEVHHVERATCEGQPVPSAGGSSAPPAAGPGDAKASSGRARTQRSRDSAPSKHVS